MVTTLLSNQSKDRKSDIQIKSKYLLYKTIQGALAKVSKTQSS